MFRSLGRLQYALVLPLWMLATAGVWFFVNALIYVRPENAPPLRIAWLLLPLLGAAAQWAVVRCFRPVSDVWLVAIEFLSFFGWVFGAMLAYSSGMTALGTVVGICNGLALAGMLRKESPLLGTISMFASSVGAGWVGGHFADQQLRHSLEWGSIEILYGRWYGSLGLWYGLLTGLVLTGILVVSHHKRRTPGPVLPSFIAMTEAIANRVWLTNDAGTSKKNERRTQR